MTACKSTQTLTASYQAVEVPAKPKKIDPVKKEVKAEPTQPDIPPAGTYGASDIRAQKLGLYALALRKWGRGLIASIEAREEAAAILYDRQLADHVAGRARVKALQEQEPTP